MTIITFVREDKMRENLLRWYGHIVGRPLDRL